MTNYIPHYTKKKQGLERKELALTRLVETGAANEKLVAAAEDVREARVRVLRAQRATIVPKGDADTLYKKIDSKIKAALRTSTAAILAEFGASLGDSDADG